jgi:hypothetical protein
MAPRRDLQNRKLAFKGFSRPKKRYLYFMYILLTEHKEHDSYAWQRWAVLLPNRRKRAEPSESTDMLLTCYSARRLKSSERIPTEVEYYSFEYRAIRYYQLRKDVEDNRRSIWRKSTTLTRCSASCMPLLIYALENVRVDWLPAKKVQASRETGRM